MLDDGTLAITAWPWRCGGSVKRSAYGAGGKTQPRPIGSVRHRLAGRRRCSTLAQELNGTAALRPGFI